MRHRNLTLNRHFQQLDSKPLRSIPLGPLRKVLRYKAALAPASEAIVFKVKLLPIHLFSKVFIALASWHGAEDIIPERIRNTEKDFVFCVVMDRVVDP